MSGILDGRVAIITGAGRGIGREHALMMAGQGAKIVVNDLGAEMDGSGGATGPAGEVVEEIRGMGGEAVANGDDVSDWEGAQRMINQAVETFGKLDILVNNAGILRDRMLTNMATPDEGPSAVSGREPRCPAGASPERPRPPSRRIRPRATTARSETHRGRRT
jgi:NAD(P)-dependent dehydrogenase (short-subunit alcohol dehydrogenase family)